MAPPLSFLGMCAFLNLVRPVQPIAQPKYSVIDVEQFVMPVVHLREAPEEVVSTMHSRSVDELACDEYPVAEDMAPEEHPRQRYREHIRKYVFRNGRVLRGERERCREAVVRLVQAGVE